MRKKPDAPDRPQILAVCRGACTLAGNAPGMSYSFVNLDGTLGGEFALSRKSKVFGSPQVGAIYQCGMEGNTFHGPATYVRVWADERDVLGWRASHDQVVTRERMEKARKAGEAEARDKALIALDPIRQVYHRTDSVGRRILLAQVIEYLQRNPAFDGKR